jgi:hypothetical protein
MIHRVAGLGGEELFLRIAPTFGSEKYTSAIKDQSHPNLYVGKKA